LTLTQDILDQALALGFDIAGVVPAGEPRHAAAFADWLAAGYHGEMAYLAARAAELMDPCLFAPDAQSMILAAAIYAANNGDSSEEGISSHPECFAIEGRASDITQGRIARYACGPDYHDAIKPKLYALDAFIRERTGREVLGKVFVDTAPVLERDFAEQAGLGFIGRNCCLITPGLGSWTVLAGLLVPEKLEAGVLKLEAGGAPRAANPSCGRCTRCLDACPIRAFVAPHVLDARRCISYLTIELRSPIPRELRSSMGNWVFGCDVCQEVCPYNRVAAAKTAAAAAKSRSDASRAAAADRNPVHEGGFRNASRDFQSPETSLAELLALDEVGFRARFRGTPVLRAKRRGLVRNACVAAGNAGDPALVPALVGLLADDEPLIRGHAAWALGHIGGAAAMRVLELASAVESDPWVREEINLACTTLS
jgi:epoxyqueuosine reductase